MTQTPPYQVTDPATGEVAETFPFATDAEVEKALAAATAAFTEWKQRPIAERAAIVKRVAELFTERAADLAALISKEMGKRPAQALGLECAGCLPEDRHLSGDCERGLPAGSRGRSSYAGACDRLLRELLVSRRAAA